MRERRPESQTMQATEGGPAFSDLVRRVSRGEARVIVEQDGVPVAAVVSAAELERFETYERQRAERFAILDTIGAAFADVSAEEIERETAKALAEVRAEMRAEREAALTAKT